MKKTIFITVAMLTLQNAFAVKTLSEAITDAAINRDFQGDITQAIELIRAGENPNTRGNFNGTLLMVAAHYNMPDLVQELLERGASVDLQDDSGTTALMEAAYWNAPEIVEMLLKKGANRALTNNQGLTARDLVLQSPAHMRSSEGG